MQIIEASRSPKVLDLERAVEMRTMNSQLRQLLSHWFSVGFLELEQVTWESPCAMLQKVWALVEAGETAE